MPVNMQIECIRQIDASEPDESGMYEYYYEYDIYRFTDGHTCFFARSYTDTPDEASFLRVETNGTHRGLRRSDLTHPLFLSAQSYLHSEGKVHLYWLSNRGNGYEPVPADSCEAKIPKTFIRFVNSFLLILKKALLYLMIR